MLPVYDARVVPSHGDSAGPRVLLMNEAPGPNEAKAGIPLYGRQGANIFHALRAAGISWAATYPRFQWPQNGIASQSSRYEMKESFLSERRKHITCTNAYSRWPKPSENSEDFCPPSDDDVLSEENLLRIRGEVISTHQVLLVCGFSAYLACTGKPLASASLRERSPLNADEVSTLNERLMSNFRKGWYMGHTRRWNFQQAATTETLRSVANEVGWEIITN